MLQGICRLCGEETKLIASHIFPEFLFRETYDEDTRAHISITNHPHQPAAACAEGADRAAPLPTLR
jgi:hypothetical protein